MRPDRFEQRRLDAEIEPRGQRNRANHPHRVFAQPDVRIANRAHHAGAKIVEAVDVIDNRKRGDVVEQRVDGEIAAERVFFRRPERVVAVNQMFVVPSVDVRLAVRRRGRAGRGLDGLGEDGRRHRVLALRDLPPERRDLNHLLSELHVGEPEAPPDDPAVPEQFLHLIRVRRRADVEVFRTAAKQQIADAAAHQIGDVIELPEPVQDLERVGIDVTSRDGVLVPRNDPRLGHRRALYQTGELSWLSY